MTDCNVYKVQSGDTLSEIAEWFHVPMHVLQRINNIQDPNVIQVGQLLRLAKGEDVCTAYTVRSGDTLSEIGEHFHVNWHSLAHYNRIPNPDVIQTGQTICVPLSRRAAVSGAE